MCVSCFYISVNEILSHSPLSGSMTSQNGMANSPSSLLNNVNVSANYRGVRGTQKPWHSKSVRLE